MGQRADRHEVGAGGGELRDAFEGHAAGDFDLRAMARLVPPRRESDWSACCRPESSRRRPRAPGPPGSASPPRLRPAGRAGARGRARPRPATPPARRMWLSLIRIASNRPTRWFDAPPARTAYFSSTRSVGVVLRVSRIVMRPPAASTNRRARVAMPDRPLEKVERSPLADEQRAGACRTPRRSPRRRGRRRRRLCAQCTARPPRAAGTSRTRRRGRRSRSPPSSGTHRAPGAPAQPSPRW